MQNYTKKGEKNEEFGGMGDCAPKNEREMQKMIGEVMCRYNLHGMDGGARS